MKTVKLTEKVLKNISQVSYYSEEGFNKDANEYLAAVEAGRILYTVLKVSADGMSRDISVKSFEGDYTNGYYRNYAYFLKAIGENATAAGNIKVKGSGMSMTFQTNYNIVNKLKDMGFIEDDKAQKLAQKVR